MTISGRVQGVWFRVKTKQKAEELDIKGTVQNLADGRVYVEAVGSSKNLRHFIQWCHQGPLLARVEQVKMESIDLEVNEFTIIR